MTLVSKRLSNVLGFLICAALLGYAYYTQFSLEFEPCPLCIFQRVALIAVAVVFLVAALHNPGVMGARVYGVLVFVAAAVGGAVSGRHVYLQNLPPDQVPECGPGLDYMLDVFPLGEALSMVFTGSGECAEVSWQFLGLTMPTWVLIWFVLLGVAGLVRNFSSR
ncbi:MAG: disulfide bond formation protein B [Thiotrichales bacterium]|nr:disulfide bond formation protein B [Thiotrichales bacterium]|tara:strand:- start:496 stop:987 length:492 start_codon:yes stop_codon:yes gene_type:complete